MTQPDKPRCETCRYWCGRVSGRLYDPGECKRYPPTVAPDDKPYNRAWKNIYPVMAITDWCGEHTPKETPDEA